MDERGYILIEPFMIDLNLPQTELFCYAVIYQFSKQKQGCFYGTQGYLAEQVGTSRQAVNQALLSLEKQGLISKNASEKRFEYTAIRAKFEYAAMPENGSGVQPPLHVQGATPVAEGATAVAQSATTVDKGATTVAQNIKENKRKYNKNIIARARTRVAPFQKPTVAEVKEYCLERRNGLNAGQFVDFYESKGWLIGSNQMKDWRAAVRTWERRLLQPAHNYPDHEYTKEQLDALFDDIDDIKI